MKNVAITDRKQRLNFLLQAKQSRISTLMLKPVLTKKEESFVQEETELLNLIIGIVATLEGEYTRQLPAATDIEEAVLGAIIQDRKAIYEVYHFLKPEHFYAPINSAIYQAVCNLVKRKAPVDLRTVTDQLRRDGKLQFVGIATLPELSLKYASAGHIRYHARVVVEYAMKRELISMGGALIHDAYQDEINVFQLLTAVDKRLVTIKEPLNHGRSETN